MTLEELLKLINEQPSQNEESQYREDNLRNKIASSVNPILNEYVNPALEKANLGQYGLAENLNIPEMSVADEKRHLQELPESMGMNTLGMTRAVKNLGEESGKRFNTLAKNFKPQDAYEDNIKALQTLRKYLSEGYEKLPNALEESGIQKTPEKDLLKESSVLYKTTDGSDGVKNNFYEPEFFNPGNISDWTMKRIKKIESPETSILKLKKPITASDRLTLIKASPTNSFGYEKPGLVEKDATGKFRSLLDSLKLKK